MPHLSTDDVRVVGATEVIAPRTLLRDLPVSDVAADTVTRGRQEVRRIVHGDDARLLVVVGPCSVHDPAAALDYAGRLRELAATVGDSLCIVMRTYFEKPRTTVGWKGLVNDPGLDGSFRINDGLHIARRLLLALNEMGMPVGTEFLDPISPQYYADLVAWGAVGARTTVGSRNARTRPPMRSRLRATSGTGCPFRAASSVSSEMMRPPSRRAAATARISVDSRSPSRETGISPRIKAEGAESR